MTQRRQFILAHDINRKATFDTFMAQISDKVEARVAVQAILGASTKKRGAHEVLLVEEVHGLLEVLQVSQQTKAEVDDILVNFRSGEGLISSPDYLQICVEEGFQFVSSLQLEQYLERRFDDKLNFDKHRILKAVPKTLWSVSTFSLFMMKLSRESIAEAYNEIFLSCGNYFTVETLERWIGSIPKEDLQKLGVSMLQSIPPYAWPRYSLNILFRSLDIEVIKLNIEKLCFLLSTSTIPVGSKQSLTRDLLEIFRNDSDFLDRNAGVIYGKLSNICWSDGNLITFISWLSVNNTLRNDQRLKILNRLDDLYTRGLYRDYNGNNGRKLLPVS